MTAAEIDDWCRMLDCHIQCHYRVGRGGKGGPRAPRTGTWRVAFYAKGSQAGTVQVVAIGPTLADAFEKALVQWGSL